MKKKICIVDYCTGNLLSIKNAINFLGHEALITSDKKILEESTHLILPGVGSFADTMKKIHKLGLKDTLQGVIKKNVNTLGICLGMQLLFENSLEFQETPGLGILKGKVLPFPEIENQKKLKLPRIGWSKLERNINEISILKNINNDDKFYFMHSYYVLTLDTSIKKIETKYYNFYYSAVLQKNNIFGCQFHPEKSGKSGLKIFKNFLGLDIK